MVRARSAQSNAYQLFLANLGYGATSSLGPGSNARSRIWVGILHSDSHLGPPGVSWYLEHSSTVSSHMVQSADHGSSPRRPVNRAI